MMKTKAEALDKQLEKLGRAIVTAKEKEAVSKIAFEQARRNVEAMQRDLYLALAKSMSATPELFVDPVTGERSESWSNRILASAIETDPEYLEAVANFEEAQEELYNSSTYAESTLHELSATRTRARLLAALMELEASQ